MKRYAKGVGDVLIIALVVGVIAVLVVQQNAVAQEQNAVSRTTATAAPAATTPAAASAPKYDPSLAERAQQTVNKAMEDIKELGERATVKVRELADTSIGEQIQQLLRQYDEKVKQGTATLKDQQEIIDRLKMRCDKMLKFAQETKNMGVTKSRDEAVEALTILSQQLDAKANQLEAQANAITDPADSKWKTKMQELAAATARLSRGYAQWAAEIKAKPVELQLHELMMGEEYVQQVKAVLNLMDDYIKTGSRYIDFTARIEKFLADINEMHQAIQDFAKAVNEVPASMPEVQPEQKAKERPQAKAEGPGDGSAA